MALIAPTNFLVPDLVLVVGVPSKACSHILFSFKFLFIPSFLHLELVCFKIFSDSICTVESFLSFLNFLTHHSFF